MSSTTKALSDLLGQLDCSDADTTLTEYICSVIDGAAEEEGSEDVLEQVRELLGSIAPAFDSAAAVQQIEWVLGLFRVRVEKGKDVVYVAWWNADADTVVRNTQTRSCRLDEAATHPSSPQAAQTNNPDSSSRPDATGVDSTAATAAGGEQQPCSFSAEITTESLVASLRALQTEDSSTGRVARASSSGGAALFQGACASGNGADRTSSNGSEPDDLDNADPQALAALRGLCSDLVCDEFLAYVLVRRHMGDPEVRFQSSVWTGKG